MVVKGTICSRERTDLMGFEEIYRPMMVLVGKDIHYLVQHLNS